LVTRPSWTSKAHSSFPMIRGCLRNGPQLLNDLSRFAGIEFGTSDAARYTEFVALPLGEFESRYELINDERREAMEALGDTKVVDEATKNLQVLTLHCGYHIAPNAAGDLAVAATDEERLAKVERLTTEWKEEQKQPVQEEKPLRSIEELARDTAPAPGSRPVFVRRSATPAAEPAPTAQTRPRFIPRSALKV